MTAVADDDSRPDLAAGQSSVKGTGKRTTSPLKKLIEYVVVGVSPGRGQPLFGKPQPGSAFRVLPRRAPALNGDLDVGILRQGQPGWKLQHSVLVSGLDRSRHVGKLPREGLFGKAKHHDAVAGNGRLELALIYAQVLLPPKVADRLFARQTEV